MPQLDLYIQSLNILHLNFFFVFFYLVSIINILFFLFIKIYFKINYEFFQVYLVNYSVEIKLFNFESYVMELHALLDKRQVLLFTYLKLMNEIFYYERINVLYGEFKFLFLVNDLLFFKLQ